MYNYNVECILHTSRASVEDLQKALEGFGVDVEIILMPQVDKERGRDFKVHVCTQDPTVVFDVCAEYGRIRSVKVEEGNPN